MQRSAFIDIAKVLASQTIVLHHLAWYSPMAEWLSPAWPQLMGFLTEHGRLAVQPFLVIAGFLAAAAAWHRGAGPLAAPLWQRYRRLAPQLVVALLLVAVATALVGQHLSQADWLSPQPSPGVLLAHLLLLQGVLDIPSISAGVWYVAIDLQLFALALLLARLSAGSGTAPVAPVLLALVGLGSVCSLLLFSRLPALDDWAIYFFGAYGLGLLAGLARRHLAARRWLALLLGVTALDVIWDPRVRPVVAGVMALALLLLAARPWSPGWPRLAGLVRYLSDISYSVFLCHFAVIILVSGWWQQRGGSGQAQAGLWFLLAWAGALLVGAAVQGLIDLLQRRAARSESSAAALGSA